MAGLLQSFRFNSHGAWGDSGGLARGEIIGKIARKNGEFGICSFTGCRGSVFAVMSFYLYLILGFIGGIPAGMGMGGGTVTIPLLVLVGGVEQKIAQCANLFSFLPMSIGALKMHADNGLLQTRGMLWIILPALGLSALGVWAASVLPSQILRKGFGVFLIALSLVGFSRAVKRVDK